MDSPLTLGKSSPLSNKNRRKTAGPTPSSVKKSVVQVPEKAKTFLSAAYAALIDILQQCKATSYRMGKDNTSSALEILEAMKHLFVDTNHGMPTSPLPATHAVPGSLEEVTGNLNIKTLQSLFRSTEDSIVQHLRTVVNPPNAPTAANPPQANFGQQSRPKAERSHDTEVVISMMKVDKQHILRTGPPNVVKTLIESSFAQSNVSDLMEIKVHGVCTLPNGNIIVNALTSKDAEQILKHSDQWMVNLAP